MSANDVELYLEKKGDPPNSFTFRAAEPALNEALSNSRGRAELMLLFFLGSVVLGAVVSTVAPTWSAIMGLTVYLSSHIYAYRVFPQAFNILLPVFLVRLLEMLAAIVLNTGVPLPELELFSHPSPSFFWLAVLYSTWPVVTAYALPRIIQVNKAQAGTQLIGRNVVITWFSVLAFAYGITILSFYAVYGAPLFDELGKYAFYSSAGSRALNALVRYRLGMVCLVGYLVLVIRSRPAKAFLTILYISLFILGADKLTAPVLALSFGLLPLLVARNPRALFNGKVLILGVLFIGAAGCIYVMGRVALANSSDAAWESIVVRLPAQSQMWYVVSESGPPLFDMPSPQAENELRSMLPFGDTQERMLTLGQSKILKDLAGTSAYKSMSEGGVSFIMILYPYILKYYGMICVVIFNFIFLLYYLILGKSLVAAIANVRPSSVLIISLLIQGVVTSLVTGNLTSVLSTNVYVLIVIAFSIYSFRSLTMLHRPDKRRIAEQANLQK